MSSSCRSICSHDCTVDFCEDRGLSLDVSYHGAGRRNLYSCSSRCSSCRSGGDSFGVTRQGGACTAWCSSAGYCGNGQDYINGGSDCRGCGSLPSSCPYTCKTCRSGGSHDGGVPVTLGTCHSHCSQYGYCGVSSKYQESGSTDCTGCVDDDEPDVINVNCEGVTCGDNHLTLDASSCGCVQQCCTTGSSAGLGLTASFVLALMAL